ncbi:MAG: hypothetical protein KDK70_32335, partial [Myxococcales bacterium]|nr:hypothetical protein [Myxococcales bacterium]
MHWLEHREVIDMAVSPDGETVVVGRDDDDMPAAPSPEEPPPWRPWLARLAEDGTRLHDWVEGRGQAHGVAMDADGRAYVLLSELYDDPDPATPERCELRALGRDGQVRWSQSWSEPSCPVDVATAAEAV